MKDDMIWSLVINIACLSIIDYFGIHSFALESVCAIACMLMLSMSHKRKDKK